MTSESRILSILERRPVRGVTSAELIRSGVPWDFRKSITRIRVKLAPQGLTVKSFPIEGVRYGRYRIVRKETA